MQLWTDTSNIEPRWQAGSTVILAPQLSFCLNFVLLDEFVFYVFQTFPELTLLEKKNILKSDKDLGFPAVSAKLRDFFDKFYKVR